MLFHVVWVYGFVRENCIDFVKLEALHKIDVLSIMVMSVNLLAGIFVEPEMIHIIIWFLNITLIW